MKLVLMGILIGVLMLVLVSCGGSAATTTPSGVVVPGDVDAAVQAPALPADAPLVISLSELPVYDSRAVYSGARFYVDALRTEPVASENRVLVKTRHYMEWQGALYGVFRYGDSEALGWLDKAAGSMAVPIVKNFQRGQLFAVYDNALFYQGDGYRGDDVLFRAGLDGSEPLQINGVRTEESTDQRFYIYNDHIYYFINAENGYGSSVTSYLYRCNLYGGRPLLLLSTDDSMRVTDCRDGKFYIEVLGKGFWVYDLVNAMIFDYSHLLPFDEFVDIDSMAVYGDTLFFGASSERDAADIDENTVISFYKRFYAMSVTTGEMTMLADDAEIIVYDEQIVCAAFIPSYIGNQDAVEYHFTLVDRNTLLTKTLLIQTVREAGNEPAVLDFFTVTDGVLYFSLEQLGCQYRLALDGQSNPERMADFEAAKGEELVCVWK